MTIVIQHQYWDLQVTEHALEVGLSFSGVPERLLVPFTAIKGLFDPSVKFGLEFEVVRDPDVAPVDADAGATAADPTAPAIAARPADASHETPADGDDGKGASVVSLDQFRKKT
jgi:hypothetical protein